jgi:NAD(P)-dependent dehydrogenase (short-subunit alcohol dehydrogenase family)
MTKKKVWLITGAGRGLGVEIARAVLATGHSVVATGRDAAKVEAAVGRHENMLPVRLNVTRPQDAHAAVEAALAEFGRIDVLVNRSNRRRLEQHGRQAEWRPRQAGQALVTLAGLEDPPTRFAAGADSVQTFETKANTLLAQAHAYRELSGSLAYDTP